jgi:hypothetical protein
MRVEVQEAIQPKIIDNILFARYGLGMDEEKIFLKEMSDSLSHQQG